MEQDQMKRSPSENAAKSPDQWKTGEEPMTGAQRSYLETLSNDVESNMRGERTEREQREHRERLVAAARQHAVEHEKNEERWHDQQQVRHQTICGCVDEYAAQPMDVLTHGRLPARPRAPVDS